jgi:hypothetical protein
VRYFFHVKDDAAVLDEEGFEFADFNDVKAEALQTAVEMIRDIRGPNFWSGEPWKLWVTDQPQGGGNTLLMLIFTARHST